VAVTVTVTVRVELKLKVRMTFIVGSESFVEARTLYCCVVCIFVMYVCMYV